MFDSSSFPTNQNAIQSFIAAIFTAVTFCVGFLPVPFTALVCYPVSAVLSILALVKGLTALRQIDQSAEAGRTLALIGIWTGALTLVGILCGSAMFALALPQLFELIQKTWTQLAQ